MLVLTIAGGVVCGGLILQYWSVVWRLSLLLGVVGLLVLWAIKDSASFMGFVSILVVGTVYNYLQLQKEQH